MILHSQERINDYTAKGWWGTDTIIDVWQRQVEARPGALAVADPLNRASFTDGEAQRWTYAANGCPGQPVGGGVGAAWRRER